jgi:hypothetical protein
MIYFLSALVQKLDVSQVQAEASRGGAEDASELIADTQKLIAAFRRMIFPIGKAGHCTAGSRPCSALQGK